MPRLVLLLAVGAVVLSAAGLVVAAGPSSSPSGPPAAAVRGGVLHVGGKPFFPMMLLDQCDAGAAGRAKRLGINVVVNVSCGRVPGVLTVLPPASAPASAGKGIGYTYPDEPEDNGWTPASLSRRYPALGRDGDGRVSLITLGSGFYASSWRTDHAGDAVFGRFTDVADMAGFDLYPLGHCTSDLSVVYKAQREFVRIAAPRPTFQWLETGPIKPDYCGGFEMQPDQLDTETWLAVVGGARGLGWFTHTFSPEADDFDVPTALQIELPRLTKKLRAVRPGLLGRTVAATSDSGAVKALARVGGGRHYVFAVNSSQKYTHAQLGVPSLKDGTVTVVGEHRTLRAKDHQIIDTFPPLTTHVYVAQG